MSLARLQRQQGLRSSLDGLADTYARFTEGFETADLKAARLMLDESACAIAIAQPKRKSDRSIETISVSSIGIRFSSRR